MRKIERQKVTNVTFEKIINQINCSNKILLIGEKELDGDSAGSILSLHRALIKLNKSSVPFSKNGVGAYHYLPSSHTISKKEDFNEFDLIITLDCGSIFRTGVEEQLKNKNKNFTLINIDHHASNDFYGDLNYVDSTSAAACEIVFLLLQKMKVEIDNEIANCLLCGLYFDTGFFMHSNTTAKNLEIAGELLRLGARIPKIIPHLTTQNLRKIKLWGRILERISFGAGGFVYSVALKNDFLELGAEKQDLEGIVNLLNESKSKAAMLIAEEDEQIKGSLRTKRDDLDLTMLAKHLNGGGHKKASGFSVSGKITKHLNGWRIE